MDRQFQSNESFTFESPFAETPETQREDFWSEGFEQVETEAVPYSAFVAGSDASAPDMAALQEALEQEAGAGTEAAERARAAAALVVGPTLRRGSRGPAVEALQRALARLGHAATIDGRFGPGTERALREFQSRNGIKADGVAGPRAKAAIATALGGAGPSPSPPHMPPKPVPPRPSPSATRRLVVQQLPLLRGHRGTPPDLILRWNEIGASNEVDVVVHFHGYSGHQAAMRIDTHKEPHSGLDFADPDNPSSTGRTEPTLGILPRGNYFGGKSGAGYDFPALTRPGALQELVREALARVGTEVGRRLTIRRLILTGHSGGGAPISAILTHSDPDEVHIFDGTYGSGASIARWAEKRIARELASPGAIPPALRILYRPGTQTAPQAEVIGQAICRSLAAPSAARLRAYFRIDATPTGHNEIPSRFGWRLLANPAADLPAATSRACPGAATGEAMFDSEMFEPSPSWQGEATDSEEPEEAIAMNERQYLAVDPSYLTFEGEDRGEALENQSGESLAWLDMEARFEPESFEPESGQAEWYGPESFEPELANAEWFGPESFEPEMTEAEWFEPPSFEPETTEELFEPAEVEWEDSEQVFETPYGISGEALTADMSTLEALLESEAGSGGLADRLKSVAAFVLGPTLQRGSSGPAVEALQRALTQLGHSVGMLDGRFGAPTERAVRDFQTTANLTSDGVVGPRTKAAIAAALGGARPAPLPVPPIPMPTPSALGDAIAKIAEQEVRRWHSPVKLRETDSAAVPILQRYYREGVKMSVTAAELQDTSWQKGHPWSAVFISFVMRTAGVGHLFKCAAAHQVYVAAARKNRLQGDTANPFWAYRATEVAPEVGDLVCASRDNSGATYDNIGDPGRRFATHCDVVTEVRPGSLRVIGGNVNQNVDAKTINTLPDGRLDLRGKQARFFAVVRCRGSVGGPAPAPQPLPQPSPQPGPGPTPPSRSSGKKLTPAQFVANYGTFAKASQARSRVPALVTLGQAALESGWGERAPRFNFFGIKAKETDPEHTRQLLRTREVYATPDKKLPRLVEVKPRPDGKFTYIVDDWFRAYPDAGTAFNAHGEFLVRNKRYAKAFTVAHDPYAFASEVARAKYATDPNYERVLHSVMRMIEKAS